MCEKSKFKDILEPRKTESGIFSFMSKAWYPKRTQTLDKIYSPQDIKDAAASSLFMEAIIEAESSKSGVSKEKLRREVLQYINEIGMEKKMHVIRWIGILSLKVAFKMNIGIYVNEPAVLKVKSTMGNNPVLFLPTHRSYADFCILTYLCYHYDIELPAVAAGMDFYSMFIMGQLMRETCAFYIRRTLTGAPLYAATLKQYVRSLVAKHAAPVEFFLEGTRSRSNKSLPPKYGMLSMTLMPLFARELSDITVVPVNISYDRLMEQNPYAYELLGVPKPKETTKGLLKWITTLNGHFGNMYINFGEPMSVRDYLKWTPYTDERLKPSELQTLSPQQFSQVQDVADYVVTQQQANSVATISNLLALVLMESLMNQRALPYDEVIVEVDRMIKVLRSLGATVFEDDVRKNVDRVLVVQAKSWKLDKDRRLRIISSEPIDVTDELKKKMKGHTLKAETMVNAIPIIQVQMYVNPMLHYLVPSALICVIVQRGPHTYDDLARHYKELRKLLRHEFFHIEKTEEQTFQVAYDYCVRNDVVRSDSEKVTMGGPEGVRLRSLLQRAVWPALSSLLLCADVMTELKSCEHNRALKLVQERAESGPYHPYCLSLDSATHCLQGFVLAGALTRDKQAKSTNYNLVPAVMAECRSLVRSVLPSFTVDFSSRNAVMLDYRTKSHL
ncbi:dihydroxyacetone phosphate acyltransferase isoform X3 [Ostrinia furnacalis]|uniref:dihydroxyacetone phosphate acyltransferase isoform X3 n=1 Tax=Ostrinia furnacalis TaxID=93504 RepID=UPI001039938F|nr:dihydroxyacetone phosphate acyltransferase isoform X3 [Ostrinia furnacalis]